MEEETIENPVEAIPEAVKQDGEELPAEVYPVSEDKERKGTMINISRDTHNKLRVEKVSLECKSFDEVIRKKFGW